MSRRIKIAKDIDTEIEVSGNKKRDTEAVCYVNSDKYLYRRAFSETQLLNILTIEKDRSYNVMTGGDVDGLSYLKVILRSIDKLDYLLISTWVISPEDICQIQEWQSKNKINTVDMYVGEIFPTSYRSAWAMLNEWKEKGGINRLCCFRNHSKIIAGYGDGMYFSVSMSCNINTNPRTENAVLFTDKGTFSFYKDFFDKINSIV